MNIGDVLSSNSYGDFEIINIEGCKKVTARFIQTGFEIVKQKAHLKRGMVKDPYYSIRYGIGFLGEVQYNSGSSKKKDFAYQCWSNMLSRCYDDESYCFYRYGGAGVTVCNSWHNYQNFAEWYYTHHKEGFEIDKDLTVPKCKVYSPETCSFVPKDINVLLVSSNAARGDCPVGVCNIRGKYVVFMHDGDGQVYFGRYEDQNDAFQEYKKQKTNRIRRLAQKHYYAGDIHTTVYENLMKWEVVEYPD